MINKTKFNLF